MNKKYNNLLNYILFFIIFIEFFYIFIHFHSFLIPKHKIKSFFIHKFEFYHIYITFVLLFLAISSFIICYHLNINILLFFLFFLLSFILYIESILNENDNLTEKEIFQNDIYDKCDTGDIILFDMAYLLKNPILLIPTITFGMQHIGIIIKKENQLYLLECGHRYDYCNYSKKYKTGVMLSDLKQKINLKKYPIYYVKTNINNHINDFQLTNFIDKYKNTEYMENNMNCISYYLLFLQELDLIKEKYSILPLYENYKNILNSEFYKFPFKTEIFKINPSFSG